MDSGIKETPDDEQRSCAPSMSRQEFLALVAKRAAIAGALLAAPMIIDAFLVPPAHALMYTGVMDTSPSLDTSITPLDP